MKVLPAWTGELREWQKACFDRYVSENQSNFLAVAVPGAGKTLLALRAVHELLARRVAQRVVVVCPTTFLCLQWGNNAAKVGIQLDPTWKNDDGIESPEDYHGIAVTYATVASSPTLHNQMCGDRRTAVVFDEIHHAGDEQLWGVSIEQAYRLAVRRLLMSGTPFRLSGGKIPFVTYENADDGTSQGKADFSYGYREAVADGVCRPVYFPQLEGEMRWMLNGEEQAAMFADVIDEEDEGRRLRTALKFDGELMRRMIREGHEQIEKARREGHRDAGGLIVAIDQAHARLLRKEVEKMTGHNPTLVISDEGDASNAITQFATSDTYWMVSVKMVSEGVDIPRLRVGIYATNIATVLYFRQFVGRFVRKIAGLRGQDSYVLIPADRRLKGFAKEIMEERRHALESKKPPVDEPGPTGPGPGPELEKSVFIPLGVDNVQSEGVIDQDQLYFPEELQFVHAVRCSPKLSAELSEVSVASLVELFRIQHPRPAKQETPSRQPEPEKPTYLKKKELSHQRVERVGKLAGKLLEAAPEWHSDFSAAVMVVNFALRKEIGKCLASLTNATVEQEQRCLQILDRWTAEWATASRENSLPNWVQKWKRKVGEG